MYGYIFLVKNCRVITVEKFRKYSFSRLVFKFDSLLLQGFGHICFKHQVSSLTRSPLNGAEYADHGRVILMPTMAAKRFQATLVRTQGTKYHNPLNQFY